MLNVAMPFAFVLAALFAMPLSEFRGKGTGVTVWVKIIGVIVVTNLIGVVYFLTAEKNEIRK